MSRDYAQLLHVQPERGWWKARRYEIQCPALADLQACTYELLDVRGELLYVGATRHPARRFRQHAAEKSWWHEVRTIRLTPHATPGSALAHEDELIRTAEPAYNRTGPRYERTKAARRGGLETLLSTFDKAWAMPS